MATITKKTALITGCSDGSLGAALALAFARHDFYVFATLRDPAKATSLASNPNIEILSLEVTSSSSISACAITVQKKTGGRLDVLVNNAGVMFAMPLLDTNIEESKKLFDVNVWGMLAVTQKFAPILVRSKGVVLNISSIAGAVRMAWQGSLFSELPQPFHLHLSNLAWRSTFCAPLFCQVWSSDKSTQVSTTLRKPPRAGSLRHYASRCKV